MKNLNYDFQSKIWLDVFQPSGKINENFYLLKHKVDNRCWDSVHEAGLLNVKQKTYHDPDSIEWFIIKETL